MGDSTGRSSLGGFGMGGMREKLEEAKRLASTKAKEVADAATERLNDTLEANPQAWSLADKAAKKAAGASAAMAATKNSIREAVDGSQQYDVLLKDKNRRILQLEDDVAILQGKLKNALGGAALAEAEQLVAQRASELSLVKDKARAVISEITQQKAALEARVRELEARPPAHEEQQQQMQQQHVQQQQAQQVQQQQLASLEAQVQAAQAAQAQSTLEHKQARQQAQQQV